MATLVGSARQYAGAGMAVAAAVCTLVAAALLMRSASAVGTARSGSTKYLAPAARRSVARDQGADVDGQQRPQDADAQLSERMIWDALDEGRDPTDQPPKSDSEGR
jgi:uncharacterized membrane protein (TIGR02234 family)